MCFFKLFFLQFETLFFDLTCLITAKFFSCYYLRAVGSHLAPSRFTKSCMLSERMTEHAVFGPGGI